MQLSPAPGDVSIRSRLARAAALLLAAGAPGAAHAAAGDPSLRIEGSSLLYAEQQRTTIFEPVARITRLFADGQSLTAQFSLDLMTGASPTGANPAGVVQTTTSPSGHATTTPADALPTSKFEDDRGALDLTWAKPIGRFTPSVGGHFSLEQDYRSLGVQGSLAVELNQKLTTVTVGGSRDQDRVMPLHGIVNGLSGSDAVVAEADDKQVSTALVGVTQVLTRRWLVGVNASGAWENGYLTEPYKVLSLLNPVTGVQTGTVREKRPDTRQRRSVQVSSAYHLTRDVLSVSYRRYEDDWQVKSNTYDVRYRMPQGEDAWLEPHVRVYSQTAASFFKQGLRNDRPLPEYGSADQRLGHLRSLTLGATYGFRISGSPGDWYVRAEYMRQSGEAHPADAIGVQRTFNQAPTLNVASIVVGWAFER
jgi:hypothetical protein